MEKKKINTGLQNVTSKLHIKGSLQHQVFRINIYLTEEYSDTYQVIVAVCSDGWKVKMVWAKSEKPYDLQCSITELIKT